MTNNQEQKYIADDVSDISEDEKTTTLSFHQQYVNMLVDSGYTPSIFEILTAVRNLGNKYLALKKKCVILKVKCDKNEIMNKKAFARYDRVYSKYNKAKNKYVTLTNKYIENKYNDELFNMQIEIIAMDERKIELDEKNMILDNIILKKNKEIALLKRKIAKKKLQEEHQILTHKLKNEYNSELDDSESDDD